MLGSVSLHMALVYRVRVGKISTKTSEIFSVESLGVLDPCQRDSVLLEERERVLLEVRKVVEQRERENSLCFLDVDVDVKSFNDVEQVTAGGVVIFVLNSITSQHV